MNVEEAIKIGDKILKLEPVPYDDLNSTLTRLTEDYALMLASESPENGLDRLAVSILDGKLSALTMNNILMNNHTRDKKSRERELNQMQKVSEP